MVAGIDDAIGAVSGLLTDAIDKIWPNPQDKAKAEALIMTATAQAAISQLQASQAVMLAEEQSNDPWTSRARPAFLYVMYTMILTAIPMGILSAIRPDVAAHIADGLKAWLAAIPDSMWTLFGAGYLGYTGGRSWEKVKGVAK
jgi:hypothetical protein